MKEMAEKSLYIFTRIMTGWIILVIAGASLFALVQLMLLVNELLLWASISIIAYYVGRKVLDDKV